MKKRSLKQALVASVLALGLVLSPMSAVAAESFEEPSAEVPAAPSVDAAPAADAEAAAGAVSAAEGSDATAAEASADADEETYSVTYYHFEMVYYDDPTFVQPDAPELEGMRLIGTHTVDGLKPGDRVSTWDQVGTEPGFTFFDAWPREIVVSENPAENAVQLNYFRDTSSVTVNYFHADALDEGEADSVAEGDAADSVVAVGNADVRFRKMGSEVLSGQLFADVLEGDELAPAIDGLQYAGSWPEEVSVKLDPTRNEINLVYGTAANLPDDALVEDDAVRLPDGVLAEDDVVTLPDEMLVDTGAADGTDDDAQKPGAGEQAPGTGAGDEVSGPSQPGADGPGSNEGPESGNGGGSGSGDSTGLDKEPATQIVDDKTPLAEGDKAATIQPTHTIPQTSDGARVLVGALSATALAAAATALASRRRTLRD